VSDQCLCISPLSDTARLGIFYGTANQRLFDKRLETCLRIQRDMGLSIDDRYIRRCGTTIQEGYNATLALIHEIPTAELPTALIFVNDLLAQGVLAALHRCGVAVPDEMSVCSFDNIESSAFTIPSLTTVESHAVLRGQEAARLALARLAHPQSPPMSITRVSLWRGLPIHNRHPCPLPFPPNS
jgi:LacI family transcriptional regulator